jgi:hypothetical protein
VADMHTIVPVPVRGRPPARMRRMRGQDLRMKP